MRTPTPSEEGKVALLVVMLGLVGAGHFLIALILAIIGVGWATRDWLNDGWVKNSRLEEARDAAMRMHLPSPGVSGEWEKWAKATQNMIMTSGDRFPNDGNHAVIGYLKEEHDAEEMDRLLARRIWPKKGCACDRDERRPWNQVHDPGCHLHPGCGIDHAEELRNSSPFPLPEMEEGS